MITDRNGLTVLSVDECIRLLSSHVPRVGRIGFVNENKPVILPVNYVFHEGTIVFRTDPGAKLGAAAGGQQVAFEVDAIDIDWRTSITTRAMFVAIVSREKNRFAVVIGAPSGGR